MFFGSEEGGRRAALMFGLLESCKAAGVSFKDWLRDVLVRIGKESDARRLVPHAWKIHFEPQLARQRDALLAKLVPS